MKNGIMRLRTKQSIPVIGWNEDMGFLIAGQMYNIDPDDVWAMYHNGTAKLKPVAHKAINDIARKEAKNGTS